MVRVGVRRGVATSSGAGPALSSWARPCSPAFGTTRVLTGGVLLNGAGPVVRAGNPPIISGSPSPADAPFGDGVLGSRGVAMLLGPGLFWVLTNLPPRERGGRRRPCLSSSVSEVDEMLIEL